MPTILDNIINELTELTTDLYEFLLRTEGSSERPGWDGHLEHYVKKTLLIRLLAGQGDRIGLHDACMQQQEYLRALVKRGVTPTPHEWDRLERWPLLLLPCLVTPVIEAAVDELIAYFRHNTCALPFSEQDAQTLRKNLFTPARTLPAALETNILTLPVMRPLPLQRQQAGDQGASTETTVRYLLQHELLDTISEYMSVADQSAATTAEHAQALRLCADRIQLLGISAAGSELIGLMDCCLLCHDALIKRLDAHRQLSDIGREQFKTWAGLVARYLDTPNNAEVVDALLSFYQRGHFIPAMLQCEYDSLRGFLLLDTPRQDTVRIEIKAVPERTTTAQIVTLPFLIRDPRVVTRAEEHRVEDAIPAYPEAAAFTQPQDTNPPVLEISHQEVSQPGAIAAGKIEETLPCIVAEDRVVMLRVPANVIDNLLCLVGESIVITRELQDRLRLILHQSESGAEQNALLRQLLDELEQQAGDGISPLPVEPTVSDSAREGDNTRASDAVQLETSNKLENVTPRSEEASTNTNEIQASVNTDNKDALLRAARVPVSSIEARLQRSVRQTCRVTGKQVNLTISGAETLLDSVILDELLDPLLHLLRNAIEHGIEPAERRRAAGKAEIGTIELRFAVDGTDLLVHCGDDGEGLNYARIQQVAAQKGLIDAGKQLSENELNRLILLPGFTTRRESSQTSGHGIGLDAVSSRVLHMKGALVISSHLRRGCVIELRVPATLVSIHALLVQSHTQVLAISSHCVEQVLPVGAGQLYAQGDRLQYRVGDANYDAYEIERLLYLPIDRSWIARADRPALLVRDHAGRVRAVFVEHVLLRQDLVVKQFGPYLPRISGIEGATILANGDVAAVIDLPGLLPVAQPDQRAPLNVPLDSASETRV